MTPARTVYLVALAASLLGLRPVAAQDVRLGGFVRLDRRLTLHDSVRLADFYNVFRPELVANFEGRAEMIVSIDMRFHDFTGVRSADELDDGDRHFPNSLTVWEALARVTGFVVEPLDLTIGKQRIHWGTADGLNPTDRFNAYDLSDLTDLSARVPVWAVRGEYYASPDWRMEAVWTPTAHAPILSRGMERMVATTGAGSAPGTVTSWVRHFEPPSRDPRNSQYGFRIAGYARGVDFSASFFDGFDGLPVIRSITFTSPDTSAAAPTFDAHVRSGLPRSRALGGDLATEWYGIGLWAEGAAVFPEEATLVTDVIVDGDTVREQRSAIDGRRYTTWTVGGDYTFTRGWYLNLQWAHGLFLERGAGQLHDYLIGKVERRLLRETVTVSLEGIAEAARWSDWSNGTGYGIHPEVLYSPVDNLDLSIGGLFTGGGGAALFGRLHDADQVYLRVSATF